MCDACKGLAFLELEGLTERQMDAARVLLCTDEETQEDKVEQAIEDERNACDKQYEIVQQQHAKIEKKLEEARDRLGPHLVDCEELITAVHAMIVDALKLVESLPGDLADA